MPLVGGKNASLGARFLVRRGIGGISLNPDAVVRGLETIAAAERELEGSVILPRLVPEFR